MKIASLFMLVSVLSGSAQAAEFWSNLNCSAGAAKLTVVELPSGEAQITLVNPEGPFGAWKVVGESSHIGGHYKSAKFTLDGVTEPLLISQRENFGRGGPIGVVTSAKLGTLFFQCGSHVDFLE